VAYDDETRRQKAANKTPIARIRVSNEIPYPHYPHYKCLAFGVEFSSGRQIPNVRCNFNFDKRSLVAKTPTKNKNHFLPRHMTMLLA